MKNFRTALAALLLPLALVMSACSQPVYSGDVTNKEYTEAYQTEEEIEECAWDTDYRTVTKTVNGKSKSVREKHREYECEGTGEFETIDHPAKWEITLEDAEGNEDTHEVTEAEYNSVEVGDYFDTGKGDS